MNLGLKSVILVFFVSFLLTGCEKNSKLPGLNEPYFGQKPPGMIPEVFIPKIFSRSKPDWAFCTVFYPGGKELYFVSDGPAQKMEQIVCMIMENDTWTEPKPVRVNRGHPSNNFGFSPDGEKIFFRSWRPLPGQDRQHDISSLWFAERSEKGWEEARPVKCGDEFIIRVGQPSISNNGTLYLAIRRDDSFGGSDIYRSRFINGFFGAPENLGPQINTKYIEADLCVSPDESFLVVTCWERPDNNGASDLYVSFRKNDKTWTALKNMGKTINSRHNESAPVLTPDCKYLFFVRVNTENDPSQCQTYWVDAGIIEDLKPDELE